MASTTYTAESTKMESDHHQAVWNPQKSPRAAPRPDVESPLARQRGAELAGDERHRQRPEDGQQDEEQQREPRTRRRHHVLDAERAAGHEDVDHEEDGDDADLRPLEAADDVPAAASMLMRSPALLVLANGRGPSARTAGPRPALKYGRRGRAPPRPIPRQSWRPGLDKPRDRRRRRPAGGPARSRARSARRSPAPSLRSTARQCVRAVLGETQSRAPMAAVVSPRSSRTSTSASRWVRPAAATASAAGRCAKRGRPAAAVRRSTTSAQRCARWADSRPAAPAP